jgi:serine/threonine protein kinase
MSNESADHFAPGTIFSLFLTVDKEVFECNACILRPFVPFTKSQVLLVELQPHICGIPSPVVLKVYDPRFINDREKSSPEIPDHPWSLSLEIAAAERRKAIAPKERLDDYDERNYFHFDELLREEFFYRATEDAFDSEVAAYSRLQDLQGEGIPRYYASGNLVVDPLRPISPHVIALEYIPGESLSTINPSSVPRSLARSLITTVCSFESHGIIHCDIRKDNILFSLKPPRAVVLDFGESAACEDESDSEWESIVTTEGNERLVKRLLHEAGIRYFDPFLPYIMNGPRGAHYWNAMVNMRGQRWCIATEDWTGAGGIRLDEPIRWKLRDEIISWLAAKEAGLLTGVDPQRPGSPDYVPLVGV